MAAKASRTAATKPIQTIYIAGNRWEIHKLTPKLKVKFIKMLGQDPAKVGLRGFCDCHEKRIYISPGLQHEDLVNCVVHEGLHAILWELGLPHQLAHAARDEKTVSALTGEILAYMKQTMEVSGL
jgi:hypothetical protein